ncbi:MAG: GNAT family N-acetyltransferase [Spirochaetes bacterium]|nr:MAG: GNAT family N-acetyltransferase [Spirochaetota bacterium]
MQVELRPFKREDFSRLIGWIDSAELLMRWAGPIFTFPLTEGQLGKYLEGSLSNPPLRKIFKAVVYPQGEVLGHVELNNIDLSNRSATLSRVLVGPPAWRGKGVGTLMVKKILKVGFEELGLHRIDLLVFDYNNPAISCYKKAGFTMEGLLRDARRFEEGYLSPYIMSMLEEEWYSHFSR